MTNFEWLKQNDELLYKALECDECPGCVFSEIENGCNTLGRKEWLNKEHQFFAPGDIIISKESRSVYVCTHIENGIVYYDVRPEMIENARARYGIYKDSVDKFYLYLKGKENGK